MPVLSRRSSPRALISVFVFQEFLMRELMTLACTKCDQRNYSSSKNKKLHPDRLELKKFCRFCRTHTLHKETK